MLFTSQCSVLHSENGFKTHGFNVFMLLKRSGWAAVIDSQGDKPLPWGSLIDKQLAH